MLKTTVFPSETAHSPSENGPKTPKSADFPSESRGFPSEKGLVSEEETLTLGASWGWL
jgi:hypothetical protein